MEDPEKQGDIIIIKRGGGAHDEHHGGVWKIAFADFMTAMMAFFLVMWLINASDEETKKAVASYFNPIELMDNTTNPKGLSNPKYGVKKLPTDNQDEENSKLVKPKNPTEEEIDLAVMEEQALFEDPLALLSEISSGLTDSDEKLELSKSEGKGSGQGKGQASGDDGEGAGEGTGSDNQENKEDNGNSMTLSGGENFRDPFDPSSWQTQLDSKFADEEKSAEVNIDSGDGEEVDLMAQKQVDPFADASSDPIIDAMEKSISEGMKTPMTGGFKDFEINPDKEDDKPSKEKIAAEAKMVAKKQAEEMAAKKAAEIKEAAKEAEMKAKAADGNDEGALSFEAAIAQLNQQLQKSGESSLTIELSHNSNGALITLSERANNGMFNIGSAKPTPILVQIMGEIGKLIGDNPGRLTVSGHTDGRRYKSRNYDNWRLSTDRAHMAYYMLIKGGVPRSAFEKIEGHADANLKKIEDPNASENRRIEVFIRKS